MKALVLYYSKEGYTMEIAEEIKEGLGADIERITPIDDLPIDVYKSCISLFFMNAFGEKPKILELKCNIDEYDLIFIGTPVLFGTYAPFMNTLLSKYSFKGKSIALFCCCDKSAKPAMNKIRRSLKQANILGEIEIKVNEGSFVNVEKINKWSKDILGKKRRM